MHRRFSSSDTVGSRRDLLRTLAERIEAVSIDHPVRVAIDGVDCAGKTTIADELAPLLQGSGRSVIRASIDGFHMPRAVRYRNGESPSGYYSDSFDYAALSRAILDPLGPCGTREYRTATFDYAIDAERSSPVETADVDAILLFDGVFLLRPELKEYWDFSVFIHLTFPTVLVRSATRDAASLGGAEQAVHRYRTRYIPGQILYLSEATPHLLADIVIQNDDPLAPMICGSNTRAKLLNEALGYIP